MVPFAHLEHALGRGRLLLAEQQLLDLWVQAGQPLLGVTVGKIDVAVCPWADNVELGIKHVDALFPNHTAPSLQRSKV